MRDPKRIPVVMEKVQKIWTAYPDLRFFQFISYLEHKFEEKHPGYKKQNVFEKVDKHFTHPITVIDLFSLEDDRFEKFLDEYIQENNL